ncbi:hypothetical protein BN2475_160007 [Paraburkholderia ribeironis]|uniref:Uncharacterized protein n=1 Tax=Paraburkholderia ribeironis TaxID=1247936 RepID=A0A1N7RU17_9BURK|nr:hypothetical protein BN2475_160007 [Paraburkholderia ribeironis]
MTGGRRSRGSFSDGRDESLARSVCDPAGLLCQTASSDPKPFGRSLPRGKAVYNRSQMGCLSIPAVPEPTVQQISSN